MIPPETPSPFEGKTVFGTGCENCAKLQAENKQWKERYIEAVNDMAQLKKELSKWENMTAEELGEMIAGV